MRLDMFLPFLRKPKKGQDPPRPGLMARTAKRFLPASWFADLTNGKPGRIRQILKRVGPTWLSAPVRRVVQAICLVTFLVLFFYVCWPYTARPAAEVDGWPAHYADDLARKEFVPAESFLVIDPLVSLSTAMAAHSWVWSLSCALAILLVCVFIPRGFCGYLCPLGTVIDLFDWSIGSRVTRLRVKEDGWWVHVKYYLLLATLVAACCGVLVSGFVAAIPVITRGLLFTLAPLQTGFGRGWHQVPPMNAGHVLSIALFFVVLGLGFLKPRFWCKYVCPSGAVFSLGNLFRVSERKVESSCINCNKCVEICPFDAIKPDFTTRTTDCTLCQTCAGVCPTQAIKFVERWNLVELKVLNDPPTNETALGRRGFLAAGVGLASGVAGGLGMAGATKVLGGEPAGSRGLAARAAARQCSRTGFSADVHPLWRMLQGLSERRPASRRFSTGLGRVMDTARRRQLGRMRVQLQCLHPGLPHRCHPGVATGRKEGLSNRVGGAQPADLPASRRLRSVPVVCGRMSPRGVSRDRIHSRPH